MRSVTVIGATGPTGIHLARELSDRGKRVIAVSRRPSELEELFGDSEIEIRVADALDRDATNQVAEGSELVVDCIGLPPERMADHPRTASIIAEAARSSNAKCLQVSSYWSFFPQKGEVISESHPREGGHRWFRLRREAEDIMLRAGAAVVHLPDFYGPHVHTSTVQNALHEAVEGKPVNWIGGRSMPREVAFVPDAMRIVADLIDREESYGTDWATPGIRLTVERLAEIASHQLERPVEVRAISGLPLRVLSWIHPGLRKIRPMIDPYDRPVRYDTSKLHDLLGQIELTPLEQAIPRTLDWIEARQE